MYVQHYYTCKQTWQAKELLEVLVKAWCHDAAERVSKVHAVLASLFAIPQYNSTASLNCFFPTYSPTVCAT